MKPLCKFDQVSVSLGDTAILKDISFSLYSGQIACLIGPSGCGKTTLLRALAGFETLDSGCISMDGDCVSSQHQFCPTEERGVGMVFQDLALFGNLTVLENIAFGLAHLAPRQRDRDCQTWLTLLKLDEYKDRFPHQLSGGQQQRVALARALAPRPRLLLLDEPFCSLDSSLKETLLIELKDLIKRSGTTVIWVTHYHQEAFTLADVVGVLNEGTLHQWGPSTELYQKPATPFVAQFLGAGTFLNVTIVNHQAIELCGQIIESSSMPMCKQGESMSLFVRPEQVVCSEDDGLKTIVEAVRFCGAHYLYTLRLPDNQRVLMQTYCRVVFALHSVIPITFNFSHVALFENDEKEIPTLKV